MPERERLEPDRRPHPARRRAIRDPVIPILFLAGLFDGISDDRVHAARCSCRRVSWS